MLSQKDGSVMYALPGNVSHLSVLAVTDFDTHYEVKTDEAKFASSVLVLGNI